MTQRTETGLPQRPIRCFMNGCFDLLHFGHINALRQVRQYRLEDLYEVETTRRRSSSPEHKTAARNNSTQGRQNSAFPYQENDLYTTTPPGGALPPATFGTAAVVNDTSSEDLVPFVAPDSSSSEEILSKSTIETERERHNELQRCGGTTSKSGMLERGRNEVNLRPHYPSNNSMNLPAVSAAGIKRNKIHVIAGIHSNEEIRRVKGGAFLSSEEEKERLLRACRFVDEVVLDVPYGVILPEKYDADFVMHGDDEIKLPDGRDMYCEVKAADKFRYIRRTEGISTTLMVERFLQDAGGHLQLHGDTMNGHSAAVDVVGHSGKNASPSLVETGAAAAQATEQGEADGWSPPCQDTTRVARSPASPKGGAGGSSSRVLDAFRVAQHRASSQSQSPVGGKERSVVAMNSAPVVVQDIMLASATRIARFVAAVQEEVEEQQSTEKLVRQPAGIFQRVVVYVQGYWDLLHVGYLDILEEIYRREAGRTVYLICGVNSEDVGLQTEGDLADTACRRRAPCFQTVHERGLALLALRHVSDVVFGTLSRGNYCSEGFRRSLGIDVVYQVSNHWDFVCDEGTVADENYANSAATESDADGGEAVSDTSGNDGQSRHKQTSTGHIKTINGKGILSSKDIVERFARNRTDFLKRNTVKREPEMAKHGEKTVSAA
ncbi:unnamed protein product [Amoebophrya sp. A120]|nr:unnamed protein product [Amoebophrya sp. A120]|eukprot:GSA120T00003324001.1